MHTPTKTSKFQSTPSVWRETYAADKPKRSAVFQSTPSVWRETVTGKGQVYFVNISIHSLRMEGDRFRQIQLPPQYHFNPLPPYGGRPHRFDRLREDNPISIHSLRMEGDDIPDAEDTRQNHFNPLPPYGGRRLDSITHRPSPVISIHSLRMEGDCSPAVAPSPPQISIHSLRMEGDVDLGITMSAVPSFQSTPSVWRETIIARNRRGAVVISIHSLRMEGD